ncbi:metallophosphoesterase family protein [Dactylosporangium sp. CA-233914]|uniref:metallophosphoesterase family protein n=1 Tax=Dactylosporangium sp. CA-233914 TaxID=3239934 RepID=UPI003D92DD2F
MTGQLLAISDLHVGYAENRALVERMRPTHDDDWLIVAGDVAEVFADVVWALGTLSERFAKVIWAPGNHELWTPPKDPEQSRGVARYERLVGACRELGVLTPEDSYAVWQDRLAIAPLFVLYDYSFWPAGAASTEQALAMAHKAGIVGTDEALLHPDPYPGRAEWSRARAELTEERLAKIDGPTVLVNHFPIVREPTDVLWYPEFALWCGTTRTRDWPTRFNAEVVVYGHLHIPRTTWHDGIRHEEVSVGYPREWSKRPTPPGRLRPILSTVDGSGR